MQNIVGSASRTSRFCIFTDAMSVISWILHFSKSHLRLAKKTRDQHTHAARARLQVYQKTVVGMSPSSPQPKNTFDQRSYGAMKVHRASVHCESNDRESYRGHGHVYWMFIETRRLGDNIAKCLNDRLFCRCIKTAVVDLATKGLVVCLTRSPTDSAACQKQRLHFHVLPTLSALQRCWRTQMLGSKRGRARHRSIGAHPATTHWRRFWMFFLWA